MARLDKICWQRERVQSGFDLALHRRAIRIIRTSSKRRNERILQIFKEVIHAKLTVWKVDLQFPLWQEKPEQDELGVLERRNA